MSFLRTVSTRRLLALIAAAVIVVGGGTAIAVAATSGGPVPPKQGLAQAIHQALAAPSVSGFSADISFTNHLIDSTDIVGVDPILTGASGRIWASGNSLRLELQAQGGDAQVLVSNGSFWIYDPTANTVYKGTLPASATETGSTAAAKSKKHAAHDAIDSIPSVAQIEKAITHVMNGANLSGAIPGDVGGQAAYTVRISPKHDGGLLGAAELAWDATHGVPLRLAIYAAGDGNPVLELKASNVSFGTVDPSVFNITPPPGAKVVNISTHSIASAQHDATSAGSKAVRNGRHFARATHTSTVSAVAKALKFKLVAPAKLVGLPRQSVELLGLGKSAGALVTYGQGLGGILVLEQPSGSGANSGSISLPLAGPDHRHGVSLPSISINGVTGQELDTALGTVVTFTRAGVSYTVLGSIPAVAADAAARAL